MIEKINIRGFKCFDDVTLELNHLTLLTGVNSAGKSSALQSILLLLQQSENAQNALNGKYVKLGYFNELKNTITNAKKIEISVNKGENQSSRIEIDGEGNVEQDGISALQDIDCVYLSAERVGVEDVYKQNLMGEYRIGVHGEFAFDYLSRERMNPLREQDFRYMDAGANLGNQVDYWLNYIMGYSVTAERISGTEIVKVSYKKNMAGSREVKPQHVGTGISYIANIIIAALSCKKESLFIVENPEIHLHPKAQSKLLDFFSFLATRGLQIIVETHSDHIFNGIRKNMKLKKINKQDVAVYFFLQKADLLCDPIQIEINEEGIIKNQVKGLFDQFDEDLDELLGL